MKLSTTHNFNREVIGTSVIASVVAFLPTLASANTIIDLLKLANTILNALLILAVTAAVLAIFYGVILYLLKPAGKDKAEGAKIAFGGVFAVFIMVSIWGIIRLLQNTLGVTSTDPVIPKGIQINTSGL